jgi:hypothetical protein
MSATALVGQPPLQQTDRRSPPAAGDAQQILPGSVAQLDDPRLRPNEDRLWIILQLGEEIRHIVAIPEAGFFGLAPKRGQVPKPRRA